MAPPMTMDSPYFRDKTSIFAIVRNEREVQPSRTSSVFKKPKKADVAEHPEVFNHVGLGITNDPSTRLDGLSIDYPTTPDQAFSAIKLAENTLEPTS
jgi:hypothetical protein